MNLRSLPPSDIHIAFVDPFSSVTLLAERLKDEGVKTTVIYTITPVCNYVTTHPELFNHAFSTKDYPDIAVLITELEKLKIDYIFYGSEISIKIADQLANHLTPHGANSLQTSHYRHDKFAMQEALKLNKDITPIKQLTVMTHLTEAEENEIVNMSFPVIGKPVNDLGSNGVKVCHSLDEVRSFLQDQTAVNLFGLNIQRQVIQEYLQGIEYFVDTFSVGGTHHISGVQRYKRVMINNQPIGLYSEIVPFDTNEAKICIDYVKQVLNCVGLNNGFSHTEIMLTKKGPYLVEVNPRLSGASGLNNKLFSYCGYDSQVELLISLIKNENNNTTTEKKYGRKVYLYSSQERNIRALNMTLLKTLPSFCEALMLKQPGSAAIIPTSIRDVIGFVLLVNSDPDALEADYQQLFTWEKNLELY